MYTIAGDMGFVTTGIVSILAKKYKVEISPYVDEVFYIQDATWGGCLKNTRKLSPTSRAMVACSNEIVGIGGGRVARDEMIEACTLGKKVTYIPAEMNHQTAIAKALKNGMPVPRDFTGAAHVLAHGCNVHK